MTLHITDISRYQIERFDPLDLARALAAGIGAVNIGISGGGSVRTATDRIRYADRARGLGMGISTYHYLTAGSGVAQAETAFARMNEAGGPGGMAHAVDCEADANEQTLRDYVVTMTRLLGRPIAVYTADWWMQPRGWRIADLAPFLWAAPNAGYLPAYPGDDSPHWRAGYGGWPALSVMQYAVLPLPGTGSCSLSAIRDPAVWTALTGGSGMTNAPSDLLTIRSMLIKRLDMVPGVARGSDLEANEVGIVGDPAHAATGGYHEGNDDLNRVGRLVSDYSKRQSSRDRPGTNSASALDIGWFDVTLPDGRRLNLRSFSAQVDAACRRGDPRCRDVREWIWSPDGKTVIRWDALGLQTVGDLSHLTHSHGSLFRDSEGRRARSDNFMGLLEEIIGGDMALDKNAPDDNALMYRMDSTVEMRELVGGTAVPTQKNQMVVSVKKLLADVEELKARPQVEPAPIDVATLKAALLDPEVKAVLVAAAQEGAEAAEDS